MVVADSKNTFELTGVGDVLEPHDGIIGLLPSHFPIYVLTINNLLLLLFNFVSFASHQILCFCIIIFVCGEFRFCEKKL